MKQMRALYSAEAVGKAADEAVEAIRAKKLALAKAQWSGSYIADLPDSAFACIQGDQRFYPHHDASGNLDLPHLRAALSRIGDPSNQQCGKAHLEAHAKAEGLGDRAKAVMPIKAKALDDDEMAAWFDGRIGRMLLSVPFGGPIPDAKSSLGVDLDGEWFSERTDIFGPHRYLRQTKERPVDWNHAYQPPGANYGDPTGVMAGHLFGKAVLQDEPEDDGWWAEVWLKRGAAKLSKIKTLAERGAQFYGSTQPVPPTKRSSRGEILMWPVALQTLTTAPQNPYSTFRAKAVLDAADEAGIAISADFRALLADMRDLHADLSLTSRGEGTAKAGRELSHANESEIEAAIEEFESSTSAYVARMRGFLERIRSKYGDVPPHG